MFIIIGVAFYDKCKAFSTLFPILGESTIKEQYI